MSGQECLAEGVEMWVCQCGCVSVNRKTSLKVVFLQSKLLRGQSYEDFYTFGQIYKPVLKHENMR